METNIQKLKALNIIAILSIGIIGSYWSTTLFSSSDLGANDKNIISIFLAIAIALTTVIIVSLFVYSTINLYKEFYKKQSQKIATILVVVFVVISDLFVFRFFNEFSVLSKLIFIFINFITVLLVAILLKIKKLVYLSKNLNK